MDNGTPLAQGTWEAASSLQCRNQCRHAHCRRPPAAFAAPGHQTCTGPDFMGGYQADLNNAVAVQTLLDQKSQTGGCARRGLPPRYSTQSIFYQRGCVLFISIHGDPLTNTFYLGHADLERGEGAGLGFNLNCRCPQAAPAEVVCGPGCGLRFAFLNMLPMPWWCRWGWTPMWVIPSRNLR